MYPKITQPLRWILAGLLGLCVILLIVWQVESYKRNEINTRLLLEDANKIKYLTQEGQYRQRKKIQGKTHIEITPTSLIE